VLAAINIEQNIPRYSSPRPVETQRDIIELFAAPTQELPNIIAKILIKADANAVLFD
jgi:hypothetical protein